MSVVGYFTAEIGLWSDLHTYSGGLGVLAGDHVKSAADAGVPLVGVTLLYHQGYACLLYTSPSPRDRQKSRMPSSA